MNNITSLSDDAKELLQNWKESRTEIHRKNWHEYFFDIAYVVASRSYDAQTKCGAVITNENREIIATGYNSFPRGVYDNILPNLRPFKYKWIMHAEANAIASCAKQGKSTTGKILYVTIKPCFSCLFLCWQAGIGKIYYPTSTLHIWEKHIESTNSKVEHELLEFMINSRMKQIGINYEFRQ